MRAKKRLKTLYKKKNADFLGLSPAPQQVSAGSQRQVKPPGPRHSLDSGASTLGLGLLAEPALLEPPRVARLGGFSECNSAIEAKKPGRQRAMGNLCISPYQNEYVSRGGGFKLLSSSTTAMNQLPKCRVPIFGFEQRDN